MFKPEVRKSHDELFEVAFSVPVVVKYVDNSPALQLDLYTTMSKSQPKHWVDFKLKGHLTSGFCCNSGNDMNSSVDSEPDPSRSLKHVYSYFYTYVHTFYTYVHTSTQCHSIDNACMRRPRNGNYFLYFEHRASDYLWIYGKICKFSLNCHYKILKKNLVIKDCSLLTKIP